LVEITTRGKPVRVRKRSPGVRALKDPTKKQPIQQAALKACWADPVWKANHLAKMKALAEQRAAEGNPINKSRFGVPDGMRRKQAERIWKKARKRAKEDMEALKKSGVITSADEKAEEALTTALELMRSPMKNETRIAAARLVLDFTKAKPASKSEVTVNKAEEWLKAVTMDNSADTSGNSST
jgi:hypothetical protein